MSTGHMTGSGFLLCPVFWPPYCSQDALIKALGPDATADDGGSQDRIPWPGGKQHWSDWLATVLTKVTGADVAVSQFQAHINTREASLNIAMNTMYLRKGGRHQVNRTLLHVMGELFRGYKGN
jgi:hypothetical protein